MRRLIAIINAQRAENNMYIHMIQDWPKLFWEADKLEVLLGSLRNQQGYLLGRMSSLGFNLRKRRSLAVLTTDVIKSSAI